MEAFANAVQGLYWAVQQNAGEEDTEFYAKIRTPLNQVCKAIAEQIQADSCAVLFAGSTPDGEERLVTRGASGRLQEGFGEEQGARRLGARRGLVYTPVGVGSKEVSLTQAVWHCGLARWANTRAEMERLRSSPEGGRGDPRAYPGKTLGRVFRNCVIVPIFAPGRASAPPETDDIHYLLDRVGSRRLGEAEEVQHERFLRNHSVVGVLKVENKRPQIPWANRHSRGTDAEDTIDVAQLVSTNLPVIQAPCPGTEGDDYACPARNSTECSRIRECISRMFEEDASKLARDLLAQMLPDSSADHPEVAWGSRWDQVCRELVDHCTTSFDATFTNEDVELLVALAMQLGRILPWRTIQYACTKEVVLDESEVGSLLIRRDDVDGLAALRRASRYVAEHVAAAMEQLKSDLSFEDRGRISESRDAGLLEPRKPLGEVVSRVKSFASLLRKAIGKHDEAWELQLAAKPASGERLFTAKPLVERLLGPKSSLCYNVRDVAGCRVTCDYLSDIHRAVRVISAQPEERGIRIRDMQEMLAVPDRGGYRAVHIDLLVKADGLIPEEDSRLLGRCLSPVPEMRNADCLLLPCELQIRTAYEDSWARKSHDLVYKLDRNVARLPRSLLDSLEILSSNLYEADRLSDIVREQVQQFLVPASTEVLHLLGLLGRGLGAVPERGVIERLPAEPPDWPFAYILFAVDCARRLYKDFVRYDGHDHFSHAVSIALQLVGRFDLFPDEQDEPKDEEQQRRTRERHVVLIALALLHDCWLAATDGSGLITESQRVPFWRPECALKSFHALLRDRCADIWDRFEGSIDCGALLGAPSPHWAVMVLDEYRHFWRRELGDTLESMDTQKWFWDELDASRRAVGDNDLADLCRLRAAMLIDRLEELPDTPNQDRRRDRFKKAYGEFRRVRARMAGIPGHSSVIGECYRVMQNVATRLGVEIPIHWYEE